MKVFMRVLMIGALGGGGLSAWVSPKLISWYFNPPAEMGFNCMKPIVWALYRMQWALVVGIIIGAVVALFLYYFVFRRRPQTPQPMPLRRQESRA